MVKVTTPGLIVGDEDKYLSAVKQGGVIHSTVTVQMPNKVVENSHNISSNHDGANVSERSASEQLKMSKESVMKLEKENTCGSSDTTEINVVDDEELKSEPSVSDGADRVEGRRNTQMSSTETISDSPDSNQTNDSSESKIQMDIALDVKENSDILESKQSSMSDITKPLTIETKFSGTSSGPSSESTDTASEVGSGFSSPNSTFTASCQNSPQLTDKHGEGIIHSPLFQ